MAMNIICLKVSRVHIWQFFNLFFISLLQSYTHACPLLVHHILLIFFSLVFIHPANFHYTHTFLSCVFCQSLFVISSDFCHWGQRFRYTYYDRSVGEIWQSIQKLDKQGMSLIETLNPSAFTEYLKKYGNTICGRHPIGVLLNVSVEGGVGGEGQVGASTIRASLPLWKPTVCCLPMPFPFFPPAKEIFRKAKISFTLL